MFLNVNSNKSFGLQGPLEDLFDDLKAMMTLRNE